MMKYLGNVVEMPTLFYFTEDKKGSVTVRIKESFRINVGGTREVVYNDLSNVVITCTTLEILFLELLYGGVPDMEVSERVKSRVLEFSEQLYIKDAKRFGNIPVGDRYVQLRQLMRLPEYTSISQRVPLHGDDDLNELLKSKRDDKKSAEDLHRETLEAKEQGCYVNTTSAKRVLAFPKSEDVLLWAFEEIVNRGKELRLCANCGHLFSFTGKRLKYCSERCSRQGNVNSYFLGNDDLKVSHNRVAATFDRRIRSSAQYRYCDSENEDEMTGLKGVFFEGLSEGKRWEKRFSANYDTLDFNMMKLRFLDCRKEKVEKIRNYRKTCGNDEAAIEEDAKQVRELVAWTEAVDQCLKNFKREWNGE